ncbi:DUF924 family protein [Pseudoalteromonas sp. BDTF-M6]|uniref:DUF924 family protein n=1 Tax=Pseudoalteromonas sp. BDTF-M6 TaxID=2796132 RepID=UPI001BAFEB18|nr:DUF924 family protein [Pseudoalteromonas sp. BDTF-M6]MBS3797179.1 DUF924 domain-containing protein [Pseudoalteromonas sp. BDTF-M6]
MDFQSVYDFWFHQCRPEDWFSKSAALDEEVSRQFAATHAAACRGELYTWRSSAHGALSEIIVLDQFSRNMYRDSAGAFAYDPLALCLAQHAVEKGYDLLLTEQERTFLYMPYMHSESAAIHVLAEHLFRPLDNYAYELEHKAIIDRFGRYPHRNALLGRQSTPEELAFLEQPNSRF